jgi:hypothetical protein
MSSRVITGMSHIYVRMLVSLAHGQHVVELLGEQELSISDKVALACRLLPDNEVGFMITHEERALSISDVPPARRHFSGWPVTTYFF